MACSIISHGPDIPEQIVGREPRSIVEPHQARGSGEDVEALWPDPRNGGHPERAIREYSRPGPDLQAGRPLSRRGGGVGTAGREVKQQQPSSDKWHDCSVQKKKVGSGRRVDPEKIKNRLFSATDGKRIKVVSHGPHTSAFSARKRWARSCHKHLRGIDRGV